MILKAENIVRTYRAGRNQVPVLKGVSLEVKRGETVSIVGASGAGKSTLLYILGGLDTPTGGRVEFRGRSITAMNAARRARFRAESLGFVFQSYHLLPELDIMENMLMPAMALSRTARVAPAARQKARELLERVGLQDRATHRPSELSGGEQQRAALARALMNDPEIVLADEPTGNLDSKTGDKVLNCLFDLAAEKKHTMLLVTHNREVAARCDRQLTLQDGLILENIEQR